ncbi:hypothetical protein VC83_06384 [Pseudogymnoascus destructans]|uniref:FHA domain-containing protein n=2 Tax=Pseudogymnoascus destructans TaxID=655981 RepID=L8GAQ8_PSED2|nr:uncharacterized protein VC83_06384 [Pseudogymnoascus destructans]ELR09984.1 hypothetical protein GMDG_00742 [Pseudogymnoascus destructans 20631-21]OAF58185.1 hypothetical protein VC83_06384 [Pseudogymnoascus destructans]
MSDTIQAKVTLTALTAGILPLIRTIHLHEYNEVIPIGRSSKNPLKHLVAATDNCWVDSDVVSRDHARLNFDSDLKRVFIEDTNSMHGTRINNKQIPKNDPIPLANNDVISLGAEVKRGIETYPECRFRVNYELLPYFPSTGRTYQLLSDDEPFEISDDEPFEVSDDDEEIQRKDSPSTSTPEAKPNTMPGALDATADDDDVVEVDPPVYEFSRLPTETARPFQADIDESMEVSDSDGDSIASSDCEPSERPIGRGSSVDITAERASVRASIEADDNNIEVSSDSGIEFSDDEASWPDSDNSDEDIGGFLDDNFLAAYGSPNPGFDTSVPAEPATNISNTPPYDPTTEGQPQLLNPKSSTHLPRIERVEHATSPNTQAPLAPMFPPLVPVPVDSATLTHIDVDTDWLPTPVKPFSMPSPSDAALKGPRSTTPPWRTEKQEFLAARVDNRAKFAAHWMDMGLKHIVVGGELSATGGSLGGFASKPNVYNELKKPDSTSNSIIPEGVVSLREKPSVQAMLLESSRDLPLKRKSDEITVDRPLEVTKAPETAQAIVSARNIKAISDARAMRRAQALTAVYGHNKAIGATNIDMTTATTTATVSNTLTKADKPTPAPTPAVKSTTAAATSAASTTTLEPTQQDQERPAKRQKQEATKAAKRFAYATISGFVAGAGLFVALVATAPDFGGFV